MFAHARTPVNQIPTHIAVNLIRLHLINNKNLSPSVKILEISNPETYV